MLDKHLAELYKVKTIALRQQVRRNKERFPDDFMFELTNEELEFMVSQSVIPSKKQYGGHAPMAFTQEGVAMLSGVLRNKKAIQVNIEIMRAFVRLRELLISQKQLAEKLIELEQKFDAQFKEVFDALHLLMRSPEVKRSERTMGFDLQSSVDE